MEAGKEISNPFMVDSLPKTNLSTLNSCIGYCYSVCHIDAAQLVLLVKQSNDVTRIQALVDKKKVVVTEAIIRDALHLDDAAGVECLPNEEIFATLARMGYEKPSTKLIFYKAFFSSQWKFLIHTILQSLSAKRTSWNEFSSAMASAVICLATGRTFNFSRYIFKSLVRNVDSSSKFYMYPRFIQLIIQNQLAREPEDQGNTKEQGDEEEQGNGNNAAKEPVTTVDDVTGQSTQSPTPLTPPLQQPQDIPSTSQVQSPLPQQQSPPLTQPHGAYFPMSLIQEAMDACAALTRRVENLEQDKVAQDLEIIKLKTRVKKLERANKGRMIDEEEVRVNPDDAQVEGRQADIYHIDMVHATKVLSMQEDEPEIQEAVEVVTTAKLITEVVAAISETVSAAAIIQTDVPAAPVNAAAVVTTAAPVKKATKELNQEIDWEVAMDHVKQKAKENPYVQRYQTMKKRPLTEGQAQRNMMVYLKNIAGFTLDFFKGMSYDDIRPIFEAKFNANLEFLLKSKEQIEEEESRAIALINETPAQKAAKRRRLNKEAEDVEELKQHLEIMPDEDDDVYTEATPLARKLYRSFITMLKNFDRDDIETLWNIVKDMFSKSKPNNFSNEYLLSTLKTMFGRQDGQDNVWKDQRSVHGQALAKSWKLPTSCGVHIISFTTTQIILLVERRYPLSKFTLEQMLNVVRLQVEEQSEMSLELIRFTRQQLQEGQHN
nr:synaptobrevin, longin-like domain protein [Tanacetum cinerariifolium]